MKIVKATYGGKDVTQILQNKIANGKLIVRADNSIAGDPAHGQVKYLEVVVSHNGGFIEKKIREGDLLCVPDATTKRLGIFYADNNEERIRPAIVKSLSTIKRAAENKADILTSMWNKEPLNPFPEFIAWTKTRSHLNQILQILQLMYLARECALYDYVSFLESDVLYAEGYFDFPDFATSTLCNMNYIGMNKDGFQHRHQHDKPTSQLTMRFNDAIQHFSNLLPNALLRNAGCIEPINITQDWSAEHPNIHVNHGRHFTSHFSIYSTKDTYKEHPYWGNHDNYKELFF